MKVIYFGTPDIAGKVLEFLLDHHVDVVAVVTKPDRPKGRSGDPVPTPVKCVAQSKIANVPVFQPEIVSAPEFAPTLAKFDADLFVVVAYGEIIKQHLLDMPKVACINMHASLLPKYRGAAPIQRCIIEGELESGVTIMHMVRKMDAGDMIRIAKVSISENMTAGELEQELTKVGEEALLQSIKDFEKGTALRTPQNHELATLAPKLELEDCEVHWNQPGQKIHNLVRGVTPFPSAWCYVTFKGQKKRLKLLKTRYVSDQSGPVGAILGADKEGIYIGTAEGALKLLELQLEGKKAMKAEELLRGVCLDQISFYFT